VDGCGDVWTLRGVDSEVFDGAGTAFELAGIYGIMVTQSAGGGTLEGGHEFVCATPEICEDLADLVPDWTERYDLSFEVGASPGAPLILSEIAVL
jgi:hypothetical protein